MPQSLANVLVHLVFSTKYREPVLKDLWHTDLHAYVGGIVREMDGHVLAAGSVEDHIHLLIQMARTVSIADLVGNIKTGSGRWIRERESGLENFHWQTGYGIFSVSVSNRDAVKAYIGSQAEHHRKVSFQDEYRAFCLRHGVNLDERYAWD